MADSQAGTRTTNKTFGERAMRKREKILEAARDAMNKRVNECAQKWTNSEVAPKFDRAMLNDTLICGLGGNGIHCVFRKRMVRPRGGGVGHGCAFSLSDDERYLLGSRLLSAWGPRHGVTAVWVDGDKVTIAVDPQPPLPPCAMGYE